MRFLSKVWDKVTDDPLKTLVGATVGLPLLVTGAATASSIAPIAAPAAAAVEQYKAGELAKEIAAKNAKAEEAATAEKIRVLEEENRRTEALARVRAAASGLSGASSELYINALIESGRQDIDWLKQVGATNYASAIGEGESAYKSARAAMWGSIGQIGFGSVSSLGKIFG